MILEFIIAGKPFFNALNLGLVMLGCLTFWGGNWTLSSHKDYWAMVMPYQMRSCAFTVQYVYAVVPIITFIITAYFCLLVVVLNRG